MSKTWILTLNWTPTETHIILLLSLTKNNGYRLPKITVRDVQQLQYIVGPVILFIAVLVCCCHFTPPLCIFTLISKTKFDGEIVIGVAGMPLSLSYPKNALADNQRKTVSVCWNRCVSPADMGSGQKQSRWRQTKKDSSQAIMSPKLTPWKQKSEYINDIRAFALNEHL